MDGLSTFEDAEPIARRKPALVADLFCGAGGSSTGARKALRRRGVEMQLVAVNHWPVAIETHSRNHPDARHYCHELARAMGFHDDEIEYEFVGTGEQVTRQIGNAVPVNTSAALVGALMQV